MQPFEYPMQAVAPTLAAILGVRCPDSAAEAPISAVVKHLAATRRVAVLAPDALGVNIWRHWRDTMPFFGRLTRQRLAVLRAVMISKTPVNFACMITGVDTSVNGIAAKEDAFACETLFDVLREEDKTSAGLGRNGWTGNELLGRFADFSAEGRGENDREVEHILTNIVEEHLPDFLIVQFGLTDETFHAHGPFSEEAGHAVAEADAWLARCVPALTERGYGILVLADHGQHEVEDDEGNPRGTHGSDSDEDCLVPLTWTWPGAA